MLSKFQANIASTGFARPNRYRINITGNGPQAAGGFRENMAIMCESISFPGQNMMSTADSLRFGPEREFITGVSYGPISASFICSPDMSEKRFFERWQEQTMDMTTWEPKYYEDYIGGMKIFQLDRDDRATYVVELFEVYPKTVTEQALGYASNDAYQTISVELDYHHWKYANERSPTPSQMGGAEGEFGGTPTGNTKGGGTDPGTTPIQDKQAYMAANSGQPVRTNATANVTVKKGIITNPPPHSKASFGGAQGGKAANN